MNLPNHLSHSDHFSPRHIGPKPGEVESMLETIGADSLAQLMDQAMPKGIRMGRELAMDESLGERGQVEDLRRVAAKNKVFRSFIGMGYSPCITPPVIQRNVLENPAWYTQYTPYQAEIAQGRLQALLIFQTMVSDLTGLPLANASLLDEATAAAEAMFVAWAQSKRKKNRFFASKNCHPQTLAVLQTRAQAVGIELVVGDEKDPDLEGCSGVLVQYPDTFGNVEDYAALGQRIHDAGGLFIVATDLLSLLMLKSPGEFGADIAVGSSQRFGVPMGYGGPHAAFFAAKDEFRRQLPGRIIGVSKDRHGKMALRMALQTREQHIRRDKATSNICTSQVLLAVMSGMYAVYHGPAGLRTIARKRFTHGWSQVLRRALQASGCTVETGACFDTLVVNLGAGSADDAHKRGWELGLNLRPIDGKRVGVSLSDERTEAAGCDGDLMQAIFGQGCRPVRRTRNRGSLRYPPRLRRTSKVLTDPVFHDHHPEHEMLRYLTRLSSRDLSLTTSMIALGLVHHEAQRDQSEMLPVSWPEFGGMHPFVPLDQAQGYQEMIQRFEQQLAEITGFPQHLLAAQRGFPGRVLGHVGDPAPGTVPGAKAIGMFV